MTFNVVSLFFQMMTVILYSIFLLPANVYIWNLLTQIAILVWLICTVFIKFVVRKPKGKTKRCYGILNVRPHF